MNCPNCGKPNYVFVIETYPPKDNRIYRRRGCRECDHRWTTAEMALEELEKLASCISEANSIIAEPKRRRTA